ncbi:carboxypeptidase M32 [Alicyclobacillus dauci]|uniref:Metal-dependent carboxypeptidase n=1 Tax=Alicyclobacillus dauci TaxID=1475485 RepID=A0ABY6YZ07_9BACL|nr:carboxypeptidase M32 [Alicyclobacillus dauci]WAH35865.1 carboxypeptidase M32 [Alicyclobacillus dauci]
MSNKTLESFRERIQELVYLREALSLMEWDLRTGAPKKGHQLRAEAIGYLASRHHELSTSAEMGEWLEALSEPNVLKTLSDIDRALVRVEKKQFDRMHKIPSKLMHEYQILVSTAESVWEDAKAQNDFPMFLPYLEKIVAIQKQFIDYWGYEGHPYNTLLDQYEPGMTVEHLDTLFGDLRSHLVPLVHAIAEKGLQVDPTTFVHQYSLDKQQELNRLFLQGMGYDFAAGRIDTTVHPFQTTINRYDVRVTTHYNLDDLRETLFGTIHEGGHALYEQGISRDLIGTSLSEGTSMGIHESQSRFWENMIGRSLPFWEHNYDLVQKAFPSVFANVPLHDFYRWINHVEPSLIRTEADEVTYNLHIMVRYELEKGLFSGTYAVADLPQLWREKMKDCLGVVPEDDATGVLQDVHWAGGSFGYFPSYALGNLYAAQFQHTLRKAIPDLDEQVRTGNVHVIREWLRTQIHQYGKMQEPAEIVMRVTGEPLSGAYLVEYLRDKYRAIYKL